MGAFKNKENGTWYVQFRYTDWRGERQQKFKRGFPTKREALAWERTFLMEKQADMNMSFESFAKLYEQDVKPNIKLNTWKTKESIIQQKILPYFGKRKLAPVISPKKTIEGVIGGAVSSVVGMLIYALVMQTAFDMQVNYFFAVIFGLASAAGSVFGDLCFSVIKRQTGIKDYGNLIPGHGGILDRFDSMMVVGPLAEALLILIPLAVK